MANRRARADFSVKGLIISLSAHLFWFCLFTPDLKNQAAALPSGSSIFLGSILKGEDLSGFRIGRYPEGRRFFNAQDSGRSDYFKKTVPIFLKPKVLIDPAVINNGHNRPHVSREVESSLAGRDMVFGVSDFSDYLDNVDFAELKRISMREDVSAFIEVQVFLEPGGHVKNIRKVAGSGDPILDLYVMRKLRTAVFKDLPYQDKPVNVKFKIKE